MRSHTEDRKYKRHGDARHMHLIVKSTNCHARETEMEIRVKLDESRTILRDGMKTSMKKHGIQRANVDKVDIADTWTIDVAII